MKPRLASNSGFSFFILPSADTTGICHHTWFQPIYEGPTPPPVPGILEGLSTALPLPFTCQCSLLPVFACWEHEPQSQSQIRVQASCRSVSGHRDKSLFLLNILKQLFSFIFCARVCWWDRVCRSRDVGEVRGHLAEVESLLLSSGYWGSNEDQQAWWQAFCLLSHLTGLTRVSLSIDLMKPKSSQLSCPPHTHRHSLRRPYPQEYPCYLKSW